MHLVEFLPKVVTRADETPYWTPSPIFAAREGLVVPPVFCVRAIPLTKRLKPAQCICHARRGLKEDRISRIISDEDQGPPNGDGGASVDSPKISREAKPTTSLGVHRSGDRLGLLCDFTLYSMPKSRQQVWRYSVPWYSAV